MTTDDGRELPRASAHHLCHPERSEGSLGLWPRYDTGRTRSPKAFVGACLLLLLAAMPALAVEPSEMLPDPALESRAREISRELRCVVCQNQSVDDSNAEVAHDIRRAVRERLVAGDNDQQVFDYMVARYGDYVLLKPPFKGRTFLLWLGAPIVLLLGALGIWLAARRKPPTVTPAPLSAAEKKKVETLLGAHRSGGASTSADAEKAAPPERRAPGQY
jgi:cytochrome c-type biogenesis protein CcmH